MDKEVKIAFKVDGLDQYITNLDDLKQALGQVETATESADKATEQLQKTAEDFDKLERRLETTEGAVKVLAGSFEILAGAASLLGVEDNEFFKELEENVIGVISLAEGAVNVAEGMKLLAQNQKLATIAQRIFNTVAKANPYVLLATSIIALVGAIAAYVTFVKDDAIPTEEELAAMREKNQKATEDALKEEERAKEAEENRIKVLEDLKQALDDVSDSEEAKQKTTLDGVIATTEALLAEQETALSTTETFIGALEARVGKSEEELQSLLDQGLNLSSQEQQLYDLYVRRNEQNEKLDETTRILNAAYKRRGEIIAENNKVEIEQVERMDYVTGGLDRQRDAVEKLIEANNKLIVSNRQTFENASNDTDTWLVSYKKAFDQFREEPEVWRDKLISDYQAGFDFAQNLNTLLTKDSEKRAERAFNLQKALGYAEAVTNTAAGITKALTDPTVPSTALRIAQSIAVGVAGAAQIATIARQKFNPDGSVDGNTPPIPSPSAAINYNFGQDAGSAIQLGGGQQASQLPPMQTYVLASDVTNAQQAQAQIQNLARL